MGKMSSMVACLLRLMMLSGIFLAQAGQVRAGGAPRSTTVAVDGEEGRSVGIEVIAEHLAVHDLADETSYSTETLERGDRVRVRTWSEGGWAVIDPPASTIGWIERASLDLGDQDGDGHRLDSANPETVPPARARVAVPRAVVRSGHLKAKMPGPPWVELSRGTIVRLVDRSPVSIGQGAGATFWYAVVPPADAACYVRAEGLRQPPRRQGVSEVLASYMVPVGEDPKTPGPAPGTLPPGAMAEIGRVDAMHRSILAEQPIEQWRLDAVRSGYQEILKRWGDNRPVEEALRLRLARVTRHEQAAAAAREFQEVLTRSRRRDAQVAQLQQRLAAVDRQRTLNYRAIGLVQPSSRVVDGRKLFSLIGADGKTIAYLDIPPGLDVEALGTRRVGVRGAVHYNQDLGTRLITVRDLEPLGTRR
jgi:hypothetical protein